MAEEKHKGGRPPFYSDVADISERIEEYFKYIEGDQDEESGKWRRFPEAPTITGMALFIGFTSRQAILNYEAKPEFVDAIKRAKLRIESHYEQALNSKYSVGPIFALKNFGWTDRQEIDHTTAGEKINQSAINLNIDGKDIKLQ